MSNSELPRLLAVFLVIFDDLQGGKVAFEVPEGSVAISSNTNNNTAAAAQSHDSSVLPPGSSLLSAAAHAHRNAAFMSTLNGPLFELDAVLQYLMPKRQLMRHLITICTEQCKILGFPVWIQGQHYPRGHFIYNVCFAFERNAELRPYEPIVRKTGRILQHMEETTCLLSNSQNEVRMHSILEQIYEDLGSYSETSIPLDGANSLDLKLFPSNPNPSVVRDWDIPVALISLEDMKDRSWDITMFALASYIDGTKSVKRIANLADIDLPLARECIQHLLFYGCIILHDLFQYTNSYLLVGGPDSLASTTHDGESSKAVQAECESYVSIGTQDSVTPFATLFRYYAKLKPALSVREWIDRYDIDTSSIDVRRMISFGIIKGFLQRIQVFPVWLDHPTFKEASDFAKTKSEPSTGRNRGRTNAPRPLTSRSPATDVLATPAPTPEVSPFRRLIQENSRDATPKPAVQTEKYNTLVEHLNKKGYPASLPALLDGEHSTDELCIRYRYSYHQLLSYLAKIGQSNGHNEAHGEHETFHDTRQYPRKARNDGRDSPNTDLGRVKLIYL